MGEKRKISVRKILQVLVTIIVTTGCVLAITSASRIQDKKVVSGIRIAIRNENDCRFIDKEDVQEMLLANRHINIGSTPVAKIDLHKMEQIAQANPWISDAQVYIDNQQVLYVNVTQRIPALRVFETNGNSYYLDTALHVLPLSDKYAHYSTIITNAPELKDDSMSKSLKSQMLTMVRTIEADSFWNAQVQEIVVTPDREFQLIPVMGNHRILIGDTSDLQDKLDNLFAFYQHVLNRIGFDKYQVLDIRFKDQVVASPSLPWKAPKDKAMSDMNWVKSILGNTKDDDKGGDGAAQTMVQPVSPVVLGVTATPPASKPQVQHKEPEKPVHTAAPAPKPVAKPAAIQAKSKTNETKANEKKTEDKKSNHSNATTKATPEKKKNQEEKKTGDKAPKYIYQGNNAH
ncbi:hypothetical protein [Taibaiella soli]|uniref:Cell division protein FtsQ n=1 Tax=Taibaiella soli TaxID=1649169 RepID=A0A2W2AJA8_9BACT|nr:hypothetical protein [Taibaiella soli]PZF72340.1 hypothetical protein DN068_13370 [Taibaiella soli]